MPRARNPENAGLPARWRKRGRAYWYSVPADERERWDGQQTYRLGASLPEAMATWAARMSRGGEIRTVGQLLERYAAEVVPRKAETTRRHNALAIRVLTGILGDVAITQIRPVDVYRYIDVRTGKTAAERDALRAAVEGMLNALPSATTHPAIKAARAAMQLSDAAAGVKSS